MASKPDRKMKGVLILGDSERLRSARRLANDAPNEDQGENKTAQYSRTRNNRTRDGLKSNFNIPKQVWKGDLSRLSTEKDEESTENVECRSTNVSRRDGKEIINGNPPLALPKKDILLNILKMLKRLDTYDLFAEPVDGDEVEHYNEIIKEPMSFAMILAKLHEDMYKTLEEFEHDVFLIPQNAMFFNSSSTIYYEQALSIHRLATKMFSELKEDPVRFAREYSDQPRTRSMGKASSNDPLKGTLNSSSGPSAPQRGRKKNADKPDRFHSRKLSTGKNGGESSSSNFVDKRLTYHNILFPTRPQRPVLTNKEDLGAISEMIVERDLSVINEGLTCLYQPENSPVYTGPRMISNNVETIESNAYPMSTGLFPNSFWKTPASATPQDLRLEPDNVDTTETKRWLSLGDLGPIAPTETLSERLNRTNSTDAKKLYNESLMSFSKDLGPVAQTLVEQKLSAFNQDSCLYHQPENSPVSASPQMIPDNVKTTESNVYPVTRDFFPIATEESPISGPPQTIWDSDNAIETNEYPVTRDIFPNATEESPISGPPQMIWDSDNAIETNEYPGTIDFFANATEKSPISGSGALLQQKPDDGDSTRRNRCLSFGGINLNHSGKTPECAAPSTSHENRSGPHVLALECPRPKVSTSRQRRSCTTVPRKAPRRTRQAKRPRLAKKKDDQDARKAPRPSRQAKRPRLAKKKDDQDARKAPRPTRQAKRPRLAKKKDDQDATCSHQPENNPASAAPPTRNSPPATSHGNGSGPIVVLALECPPRVHAAPKAKKKSEKDVTK